MHKVVGTEGSPQKETMMICPPIQDLGLAVQHTRRGAEPLETRAHQR